MSGHFQLILRNRRYGANVERSMKQIHMPRVDAQYWTATTLASVFGTNLGGFYAHESGLGRARLG